MTHQINHTVSFPFVVGALSTLILSVPGKKVVSIISEDIPPTRYSIDGESIGKNNQYQQQFMQSLAQAILTEGGVIIAQIDELETIEVDTTKGKSNVCINNMLGVNCSKGGWNLLTAEALEILLLTNPRTRKRSKTPLGVRYCNWSLDALATY